MKTGDIAFVKKFRLADDPFKLPSIEPVTIEGKVISVQYPSFTVKYDQPDPDGYEYQEFHVNHLPETVTVKDGNPTTVLAVMAEIVKEAHDSIDPSDAEKVRNLPLVLLGTLMRLEAICEEHGLHGVK